MIPIYELNSLLFVICDEGKLVEAMEVEDVSDELLIEELEVVESVELGVVFH